VYSSYVGSVIVESLCVVVVRLVNVSVDFLKLKNEIEHFLRVLVMNE
jgi:hypothetical protein